MPHHRKSKRNQALSAKLEIVTKNLKTMGKVINMEAIRQEVESGKLKLKNVVRELLNYSESLDPASMEKANFPELSDDLAKLVSVVKTECGVTGEPCRDFQTVVDGGNYLMGMQTVPQNLGVHFKEGGPFKTLVQVKVNYDAISALQTSGAKFQTSLIAALDLQSKNDDDWVDSALSAYLELKSIMRIVGSLSKLTDEQLKGVTNNTSLGAVNAFIDLQNVFSNNSVSLDALESKLGLMAQALLKFTSVFSPKEVTHILNRAQLLVETSDGRKLSMDEKKSTHGFPNGAKDLEKLQEDLKSTFVKEVLTDDEGLEFIRSLYQYFSDLYKEMQSVLQARNSAGGHQLIHHFKTMKSTLESALTDVESLVNSVPKLHEHVKKLNGVMNTLKSINWADEKGNLQKIQSSDMNLFCTQANNISLKSAALSDLLNALGTKVGKMTSFWIDYKNFDAVKTELSAMIAQLAPVNLVPLDKWSRSTDILRISSNPLLNSAEIDSAFTFIQEKTDIKNVLDSLNGRTSFSNILKFGADNSTAEVQKAAKATKPISTEYAALEKRVSSKQPGSFKKSENKKVVTLQASADFNRGVMMVSNLQIAHASKDKLNYLVKILNGTEARNWRNSLNPKDQKEFDKLLGPKFKKNIATLLQQGEMLARNVTEVPRNISGHVGVLKAGVEHYPPIDTSSGSNFVLEHNGPRTIYDALASFQNMGFANGNVTWQSALQAIPFLLALTASSLFGRNSMPNLEDLTTNGGSINLGLLIGGVSVGIIFIGAAAGGVSFYMYRKRKNDNKKADLLTPEQKVLVKLEFVKDSTGHASLLVTSLNVKDTCTPNSYCHTMQEEECRREPTIKDLKQFEPEYVELIIGMLRAALELESKHTKPSVCQKNMVINVPSISYLQQVEQLRFDNTCKETNNEVVYNLPRTDYFCGRGVDTFRPLGIETEIKQDLTMKTARKHVVKAELSEEQQKVKKDIMEVSSKVNRKMAALVGETEYTAEDDNREEAGGENRRENQDIENFSNYLLELGKRKEDVVYEFDVGTDSDESDEDEEERADGGAEGGGSPGVAKTKGGEAQGPKAEGERKKGRKETPLEVYNRTPEQLLECINEPLKPTDEVEPEANFDNTRIFFDGEVKNADESLNIYVLLRGYCLPRNVNIKRFPYKDEQGNVFGYMMPLNYVLILIEMCIAVLRNKPACLRINREMHKIGGDIHGKLRDLLYQLSGCLDIEPACLLLLGDYVDRGPRSVCVLIVVMLCIILNPDKFNALRGNHEFPNTNAQYGFLDECKRLFGSVGGRKLFCAFNRMFTYLPRVAILNNKMFCVHGGLTKEMLLGMVQYLAKLKKIPTTDEEMTLLMNHEWGDPIESYSVDEKNPHYGENKRNCPGVYSCSNWIIIKILKQLQLKGLIRGHQVTKYGYRFFAGTWGITIFGSTNNEDNNWACQLTLTDDLNVEIDRFINNVEAKGPKKDELTLRERRKANKKNAAAAAQ